MNDLEQTIKALHYLQKWRRGANIPMPEPVFVGKAIDEAIRHLRKYKRLCGKEDTESLQRQFETTGKA